MKTIHQVQIGIEGEQSAEMHLCKQGFVLIARNYRCSSGEIDLIMQDKDTLVFVEVKRRKTMTYGSPLEAISLNKQQKIISAAQQYMLTNHVHPQQKIRFDAVGIIKNKDIEHIQWIPNAF